MSHVQRYLPWGVVTLAAVYLAYCALPAKQTTPFHLDDFGALPIQGGGRVQPLDSFARNTLLVISGKQTFDEEFKDDSESDRVRKVRQPAIKWLLDVWMMMSRTQEDGNVEPRAKNHKVFRIDNLQVLAMMQLEPREGFRYSLAEIEPGIPMLFNRYQEIKEMDKDKRDLTDEKVGELVDHFMLFRKMATYDQVDLVPPERAGGEWLSMATVDSQHNLPAMVYEHLLVSAKTNDSQQFNKVLDGFRSEWLAKKLPADVAKAQFESFFNRFAPFYHAIVLYIFVFLLACLSWLGWSKELGQSAFVLVILTLVLHTWALIARMYMMDRWFVFVTNLYASGIFIGWGCAMVGLFLEYVYRNGVGCVVGSVTGALSLYIAHNLSLSGDTLNMVVAVLDTNFWLATHVTCITFGYSATFMAGFLAIAYIVAGLVAPNLSRETTQDFTRMIYGVICFATLLSFTGTVLGGIWADQSWGRFWGWDPKENGALLIVLMNALILHARWGGMIKARGLAVLAVLGNIVVAWSWFGVNMLGVGLHSYGFMEGAYFWLITFVISQLVIAGIGMVNPATIRKLVAQMLALNPQTEQKVPV